MMQKGLEINFYDMLRQIRKKWAVLLAFVLIFAVAADFYGYRRASLSVDRDRRALEEYAQSMGTTVDALPEHMTVELAELRSALTEEEASFVEAAAKLYMYRMWAFCRRAKYYCTSDAAHKLRYPDVGLLRAIYSHVRMKA